MSLNWSKEKHLRRAIVTLNDSELSIYLNPLDEKRCILACHVYHWLVYQRQSTMSMEELKKIAEEQLIPQVIAWVGSRESRGFHLKEKFEFKNDPLTFVWP